jgi:type VI secretion system protein ImpA
MDLDTLLLPVSDSHPCGVPLLHEPEYDDIGAARLEDDASQPRGVWTSTLKKANWKEVVELCEAALSKRGKDLQVAVWLGEAWIALDGIAGGVRAVALLNGLCERFWPDLHPAPRGSDFEFRTAPLDWADEHWSRALLLRVPLICGSGPDPRSFTLAQWNEAAMQDNAAPAKKDARKGAAVATGPTLADIMAALATMPLAAVTVALDGAREWTAQLERLNASLELLAPGAHARLRKLDALLLTVEDVLQRCVEQHPQYSMPPTPVAKLPPPVESAVVAAVAEPEAAPEAPISGRADAYQQLERIAAYLSRVEPHSPVPSLIRRACEWGDMPFDALMDELMKNNGEMQKILWRVQG